MPNIIYDQASAQRVYLRRVRDKKQTTSLGFIQSILSAKHFHYPVRVTQFETNVSIESWAWQSYEWNIRKPKWDRARKMISRFRRERVYTLITAFNRQYGTGESIADIIVEHIWEFGL